MDRAAAVVEIQKILEENLHVEMENALEESTTFESLEIDSLDMVELILAVEESFGVSIENNLKIESVGALIDYVASKKD